MMEKSHKTTTIAITIFIQLTINMAVLLPIVVIISSLLFEWRRRDFLLVSLGPQTDVIAWKNSEAPDTDFCRISGRPDILLFCRISSYFDGYSLILPDIWPARYPFILPDIRPDILFCRISGRPDILLFCRIIGRPDILLVCRISGRPDILLFLNLLKIN